MRSRTVRRQLLADVLGDDARAALARFATGVGVPSARAQVVADAAVVRVFRGGVPRDRELTDTLLRLEVRRVAAATGVGRADSLSDDAPAVMTPRPVLRRRIGLARIRRVGLIACAAGAACALTVGASFAIIRADQAAPASAPEGPAVPPPSLVEEPTAPATPRVLGPVTEGPGLPAASPLLEGMLENAGPGWSLLQLDVDADADGRRSVYYLTDPQGALYEVPTPLVQASWYDDPTLVGWLPGTRLVLTSWSWGRELAVVDVLTGERFLSIPSGVQGHTSVSASAEFVDDGTTDVLVTWVWYEGPSAEPGGRTVRLGIDGTERATMDLDGRGPLGVNQPVLSDDGTRLAFRGPEGLRVVDAADFAEVAVVPGPYPADAPACRPDRWLGDADLLVTCTVDPHGYDGRLWIAPVDGGESTRLESEAVGSVWAVGDALVLVQQEELSTSTQEEPRWGYGLHRCGYDGACEDARYGEVSASAVAVDDGTLFAFEPPVEMNMPSVPFIAADLATGQERVLLDPGPHASVRAVAPWGGRHQTWFGLS